jgi:hypothetical protein
MQRLLACFVLLMLCINPVLSQTITAPPLLNFQGRLAKPDGTPVPDGSYSVKFSLFTAAAGGTQKWTETVSAVHVRNGLFAVLLGKTTALTDAVFAGNLWLEIKVGSDPALTPRQQLVTVAYAFKADTVPDASIGTTQLKNGAVTPAKLASGVLNPIAWLLGGNSGTNPATQFLGTTDNQPLVFRTNNTEKMRILSSGNVGIGTPGASYPLDIVGRSRVRGAGGVGGGLWMTDSDSPTTDAAFVGRSIDSDAWTGFYSALNGWNLVVKDNGNVGIHTGSPFAALDVAGSLIVDHDNLNSGTTAYSLNFGGGGEAIASKRTAGGNQYGLDLYTNYFPALSIANDGKVGIGTTAPQQGLSVFLGMNIDQFNINNGSLIEGLTFGSGSGEGIGSKRTSGFNRYGLDFYTSFQNRMIITNDGRVGIGYTDPADLLEDRCGSFSTAGGALLSVNGSVTCRGNIATSQCMTSSDFADYSDARYKTHIATMENALDAVLRLRGVTFEWRREEFPKMAFRSGRQVGFLAQEVEEVLPEIVRTNADGYKTVAYGKAVPLLVEAMKQQQQQIEALKAENAALKARQSRMDAMEAQLTALAAAVHDLQARQAPTRPQ